MKQIIVEDDRSVSIPTKVHERFNDILDNIEDVPHKRESFPRSQNKSLPIPSFGIIYVFVDNVVGKIWYFICQRRSTIEFAEVLRCGPRKDHLFEYFSVMTQSERELILEIADNPEKFHKVWDDFLLDEINFFTKIERKTRKIFDIYSPYLRALIELTTSNTIDAPWGFPKGRQRTTDATRLETALREFHEETKIKIDNVQLLIEDSINYTIRGTDGCIYTTNFFVVNASEMTKPPLIETLNNCIHKNYLSNEMKDYKWIGFDIGSPIKPKSTPLSKYLEKILINIHNTLSSDLINKKN